jgi:hypothetical protein
MIDVFLGDEFQTKLQWNLFEIQGPIGGSTAWDASTSIDHANSKELKLPAPPILLAISTKRLDRLSRDRRIGKADHLRSPVEPSARTGVADVFFSGMVLICR